MLFTVFLLQTKAGDAAKGGKKKWALGYFSTIFFVLETISFCQMWYRGNTCAFIERLPFCFYLSAKIASMLPRLLVIVSTKSASNGLFLFQFVSNIRVGFDGWNLLF